MCEPIHYETNAPNRSAERKVLAFVDGQLLPIPINLDTVNRLYGLKLNSVGLAGLNLRGVAKNEG